jgi:hypothetical protein
MQQGIPRALVNALMAATVLAWSVAPPPIQHRHEEGADLSHHHDGGEPHLAVYAPHVIGGEVSHLHIEWLGLRLTLPDDGVPTKKGEDRGTSKLLFVQASRASVAQVCSPGGLGTSLTVLSLKTTDADVGASSPTVLNSLLRLTPHPLCDRARHERSGVQLA